MQIDSIADLTEMMAKGRRHYTRYPWEKWDHGAIVVLRQGTAEQVARGEADFCCDLSSFYGALGYHAARIGAGTRTKKLNREPLTLAVQFVFGEAEPA